MRYQQQFDGDMVRPVMKGYKMCCCHCCLIHVFDFFVVRSGRGHRVEFRVRQDKRATAAARRKKRKEMFPRFLIHKNRPHPLTPLDFLMMKKLKEYSKGDDLRLHLPNRTKNHCIAL